VINEILIALAPNNREKALLVWICIFSIYALYTSKEFKNCLKIAFKQFMKLWWFWIFEISCIMFTIYVLYKYNIISVADSKIILIWFITSFWALNYAIFSKKNLLISTIKMFSLCTIFIILLNYSSFSFIVEFIMLPLLCWIFLCYNFSSQTSWIEKNNSKYISIIPAIFGIMVVLLMSIQFIYSFINIKEDINKKLLLDIVREESLYILFTLLSMPMMIILRLYTKYETQQVRKKQSQKIENIKTK